MTFRYLLIDELTGEVSGTNSTAIAMQASAESSGFGYVIDTEQHCIMFDGQQFPIEIQTAYSEDALG
jgi:hypothetical protein